MTKLVAVVDDAISVRGSPDRLIRTISLDVSAFASVEEFLPGKHPRKVDCLIWDVRLPEMSGIELHLTCWPVGVTYRSSS
jgi:FixJ family two-component response regulator